MSIGSDEIVGFLRIPFATAVSGTYLYITAALALNFLGAFFLNNPLFGSKKKHWGVFAPILLWAGIMAWAFFMQGSVRLADDPKWPLYVLQFLLFMHLPVSAFAILFATGHRYYATSVCVLLSWLGYCAYEVAVKAVTGAWVY